MVKLKNPLRGYRVRVTVDLPVWEYDSKAAKETAEKIVKKTFSTSKVINSKVIEVGPPDNKKLFPEDQPSYNPSKR